MVGPMARPGARGLGPGLSLKYEIVLRAGPGLDIIVAGRAGPGPHNSICGPGPGRVCTTAVGPGRAWSSNHISGPGPRFQARAGPYLVHGTSDRVTMKRTRSITSFFGR